MTRSSSIALASLALVTLSIGALACGQLATIGSDRSDESALSPNGQPGPADASLDPAPTPDDAAAPPIPQDASLPSPQGTLTCPSSDAGVTYTYDRSCTAASDCVIGFLSIDCCGSQMAYGINAAAKSRFDETALTCGIRGVCDCAAEYVRSEDGATSLYADHHDLQVGCADQRCITYIAK
ncbi:hypothetical protein AKJ09_05277 [Labilithrix luteola]|uniref:Lipoprotein n=1 Tax=Labilithrix luteola TaxID=1391654 RepID=A0A0K1PYK7_9BACT|nr:hypothetical protein [Labilithrix luteola]AKU98613.1 hypothetical protein AKJ09_05277 [Labilithrix luteola]